MPDIPSAKLISERFEVGRHFCNKLWNAVRFALPNLEQTSFVERSPAVLPFEERWILSRLTRALAEVRQQLEAYNPSAALSVARDFFWSELCDWYLEMIKPRLRADGADSARQVLAFCVDQTLRLFHPFIPFVTDFLWQQLNARATRRGIESPLQTPDTISRAPWPQPNTSWQDEQLEQQVDFLQAVIRAIRDIRSQYTVPPKQRVQVRIKTVGEAPDILDKGLVHIQGLAGVESVEMAADAERTRDSATAVVGELEVYVLGVIDIEKERARLNGQIKKLNGVLAGVRKKLGNEKFLSRANPEVVAKERSKLADMESQLGTLNENLAALG
ncbi:MAG: class I tRNA ligase family protein [Desulfurellaceae bacterium]|nr:class I tRNA ligase family protein [Desulfurellaceae bacterium]